MNPIDLGVGIRFPAMFSAATRRTAVISGLDKVNQSLSDIFGTRKGERVLQPEYGSDLHRLLFDMNDEILEDMLKIYVLDAIEKWETRITVEDISTQRSLDNPHQVDVIISYRINNSNIRGSYVYPFRREPMDFPGLG